MPSRPTHLFGAFYENKLVGVLVFATPNAFSDLLGKNYSNLEKLISRGATNTIAPCNTASWLITKSIKWMVCNTEFRYFTGYSDPLAGELGIIYQSCNFIYLGSKFGAPYMFRDPNKPEKGWFSSREFRKLGSYKRYAKLNGIEWQNSWNKAYVVSWDKIPSHVIAILKETAKSYENFCEKKKVKRKHKYVFIKGNGKKETIFLRNLFKGKNPNLIQNCGSLGLPYPKVRGK